VPKITTYLIEKASKMISDGTSTRSTTEILGILYATLRDNLKKVGPVQFAGIPVRHQNLYLL
jgi:hypothetical protein